MRTYTTLGLVGAGAFLLFLVSLVPARVAFSLAAPEGAGAVGIRGSLWNGSAELVTVNGIQLRETHWDISPWELLIGRVAGDIRSEWAGGSIEGHAGISLGGTMRAHDLRASLDLGALQSLIEIPDAGGKLSLRLNELVLEESGPTSIDGIITIERLSTRLLGGRATELGNFELKFAPEKQTEPDQITGILSDRGGPLELAGTLAITPPADYAMIAKLRTRDDASQELAQAINILGQAGPDGLRTFSLSGSL